MAAKSPERGTKRGLAANSLTRGTKGRAMIIKGRETGDEGRAIIVLG